MAAHGYRAVAPDLHGYGDTTGAPVNDSTKCTTLHVIGDIVGLPDKIAPAEDKVFVVGHDWGAYIGWYLCLHRPDRVKALVNLSVHYLPRNPTMKPVEMFRFLYGDDHYICRFQDLAMAIHLIRQLSCLLGCQKKMLISMLANLRRMASPEELTTTELLICENWELTAPWTGSQVKLPVKFIVGDLDLVYDIRGAKEYINSGGFKKDVPLLDKVVVMEGVAHFLNQEKPDEINKHILEFIKKVVFGWKGIKFSGPLSGEEVELTVRNGSSLRLRIPDGHVTSYKPNVYWKADGFEEVLYTIPGQEAEAKAKAKGGIGLVINDVSESEANSKPVITSQWTLKDVDSDSIDALQVELSCKSGNLDISYVVSLYPVSMATAVIVKNNGRKPVKLTGAILNHFKFKKRDGTSIKGLRSCSYFTHPPLTSPFQVLFPSEAMKYEENPAWFSFGYEPEKKPGVWSVQDVPITILKSKLSRVYAAPPEERRKHFYNTAPSKYETIDQGRELFFRIIKIGF
ncbi:unnamed protein product [Camellia sinensis]